MPIPQLLTINRIINIYICAHPVAVTLQPTIQGYWEDCLPLFAAPALTMDSITTLLEQAQRVNRIIPTSESIDVEEMLNGIRSRWQITFFENSAVRITPSIPTILTIEEGKYKSWQPMQGQSFLEAPTSVQEISSRIMKSIELFQP